MNKAVIAIVALNAALAGCFPVFTVDKSLVKTDVYTGSIEQTPSDPRDFRADVSFNEIERSKIRDYLNRLSEKTGYHIGVVFDRPHTESDDRGDFVPNERKVIFKTTGIGGTWMPRIRVIRVGTQLTDGLPGTIARLVAHEMAHDIGLEHTAYSKPASLMQPKWSFNETEFVWTDLDQKECERIGGCHPITQPITTKNMKVSMDEDEDEYEDFYGDDEGDLIDGVGFADPNGNSALRAETDNNPRIHPCPSCNEPNVLTTIDVRRHYQCDNCANRAEGYGD